MKVTKNDVPPLMPNMYLLHLGADILSTPESKIVWQKLAMESLLDPAGRDSVRFCRPITSARMTSFAKTNTQKQASDLHKYAGRVQGSKTRKVYEAVRTIHMFVCA